METFSLTVQLYLLLSITRPFSCEHLSEEQCVNAEFVPGHRRGGVGYDVTTLRAKVKPVFDLDSAKECHGYFNPHTNTTQKVPDGMIGWQSISRCSQSMNYNTYHSSREYINSQEEKVNEDWSAGLAVGIPFAFSAFLNVAGSSSETAKFAQKQSTQTPTAFLDLSLQCELFSFAVDYASVALSSNFLADIKRLPPKRRSQGEKEHYQNFIDDYGTHFLSEVTLGGYIEILSSIDLCTLGRMDLSLEDTAKCMSFGIGGTFVAKKFEVEVDGAGSECEAIRKDRGVKGSFTSLKKSQHVLVHGGATEEIGNVMLDGDGENLLKKWIRSIPSHPEVVKHSLKPIWLALDSINNSEMKETDTNILKSNLNAAVGEYLVKQEEKAIERQCRLPDFSSSYDKKRSARTTQCTANRYTDSKCCPHKAGYGTLKISNLKATGMDDADSILSGETRHLSGDPEHADAYVKIKEYPDYRTIAKRDVKDAKWDNFWELPDMQAGTKMNILLMDKDHKINLEGEHDTLVTCMLDLVMAECQNISCIGEKNVTLSFTVSFECPPFLTGSKCDEIAEGKLYCPNDIKNTLNIGEPDSVVNMTNCHPSNGIHGNTSTASSKAMSVSLLMLKMLIIDHTMMFA